MALSSALITSAARSLLVNYGLQDVSMRRVAKELDVAPSALYYHVANKQELLTSVAYEILIPLRRHEGNAVELMVAFRQLVLPLRDLGDLLLLAYALDPELPPAPMLSARLISAGWTEQDAQDATAVMMRFALGAIATEQNGMLLKASEGPGPNTAEAVAADVIYHHGLSLILQAPRA